MLTDDRSANLLHHVSGLDSLSLHGRLMGLLLVVHGSSDLELERSPASAGFVRERQSRRALPPVVETGTLRGRLKSGAPT